MASINNKFARKNLKTIYLEIVHNHNVWHKVKHVLFPAAKGHLDEVGKVGNTRAQDIAYCWHFNKFTARDYIIWHIQRHIGTKRVAVSQVDEYCFVLVLSLSFRLTKKCTDWVLLALLYIFSFKYSNLLQLSLPDPLNPLSAMDKLSAVINLLKI